MSIYSCALDGESGAVASSISADYVIETTRRYLVISDATDDETYVRAHFGLGLTPVIALFKSHPDEAYTRCKSVAATYQSHVTCSDGVNRYKWVVVATFGFLPLPAIVNTSASGDPADAQLEVAIEGVEQQKVVDQDINGRSVVNSAGVPYDPPVMRDDLRCVIKISRNEKNLTPATILSYANKLNQSPWNGLPAKSCKMACPRITPQYSPFLNVIYYRVDYTIEYNPDLWAQIVLDAGYQWLDRSVTPAKLRNILDAQGLSITSPGLLDGNGKPLALPAAPASVVWTSHDIYFTSDFDALQFPPNIFVTVPYI